MSGKSDLSDFLTNDCRKSALPISAAPKSGLPDFGAGRFHSQGSALPVGNSG
jgi:hypothetical protein